jgi:hypothetical protein
MKAEIKDIPEGKPSVVRIRLIPEKESEREAVRLIREALRGTTAIATTPTVDDERVLSLMFNVHAKKNQKTKA